MSLMLSLLLSHSHLLPNFPEWHWQTPHDKSPLLVHWFALGMKSGLPSFSQGQSQIVSSSMMRFSSMASRLMWMNCFELPGRHSRTRILARKSTVSSTWMPLQPLEMGNGQFDSNWIWISLVALDVNLTVSTIF